MNDLPPSFIISPLELVERREKCKEHLRSVGLEPQSMYGLYGEHMRIASEYNMPGRPHVQLTSSAICLAINHWSLWQHIALSGIPEAIIFEDDVLLPENFPDLYFEVMEDVPDDWDMLYLSILYPKRIKSGDIRAERVADNVWKHECPMNWDGACDGLHAYVLTEKGAKKISSLRFALDQPVDRWVSFNALPYLETYIWMPSPVRQRSQVEGAGSVWGSTLGNTGCKEATKEIMRVTGKRRTRG